VAPARRTIAESPAATARVAQTGVAGERRAAVPKSSRATRTPRLPLRSRSVAGRDGSSISAPSVSSSSEFSASTQPRNARSSVRRHARWSCRPGRASAASFRAPCHGLIFSAAACFSSVRGKVSSEAGPAANDPGPSATLCHGAIDAPRRRDRLRGTFRRASPLPPGGAFQGRKIQGASDGFRHGSKEACTFEAPGGRRVGLRAAAGGRACEGGACEGAHGAPRGRGCPAAGLALRSAVPGAALGILSALTLRDASRSASGPRLGTAGGAGAYGLRWVRTATGIGSRRRRVAARLTPSGACTALASVRRPATVGSSFGSEQAL